MSLDHRHYNILDERNQVDTKQLAIYGDNPTLPGFIVHISAMLGFTISFRCETIRFFAPV